MELLEQHFDAAFAAPDGIKKLRELILTLAMQGKLVPQDPKDQPASALLKQIEAEKKRLVMEGQIREPKPLPPVEPEDAAYSLPKGWVWSRIGQVCSYIQRGKGPKYVDKSQFRVVSQKCVRWWGLDLEPARFIEPESLSSYEPIRFLIGGEVLWNSTGTGTIGRACTVPNGIEAEKLVADSHVTVLRPLMIRSGFLWRWIQCPFVQDEIETMASGTTNQIELNTSTVVNHLIPLPPWNEQDRIVARINELMARCDALEKLREERKTKRIAVHTAAVRKLLNVTDAEDHKQAREFLDQHFGELYTVKENVEDLRKAILQLAVMGKLVPQDPKDPPASELLKRIEAERARLVRNKQISSTKELPSLRSEEIPFQLPVGWKWIRLGELGYAQTGTTPPSNNQSYYGNFIPFVGPGDIKDGKINYFGKGLSKTGMSVARVIEKGSLLMVCIGGSIGKHAVNDRVITCNQQINTLTPYAPIPVQFIYQMTAAPIFQDVVIGNSGGSATPIINKQKWTLIPIPLPPLNEQNRIVAEIDRLMSLSDALEQEIDAAGIKQSALLNAMMAQIGRQRCA